MSDDRDDRDEQPDDELRRAVRDEQRRQQYMEELRDTPIADKLKMAGSIGWLIVIPTLIGTFTGRWIDQRYDTGIFWTASLIFTGIAIGSYFGWRQLQDARGAT